MYEYTYRDALTESFSPSDIAVVTINVLTYPVNPPWLWWPLATISTGLLVFGAVARFRLAYWNKRLREAQARSAELDAELIMLEEYGRYLDEYGG